MPHRGAPYSDPSLSRDWLETTTELAVGILPLALVILGIGMMSFAPKQSSVPLFRSIFEAKEFYKRHELVFSYEQPMVIVSKSCSTCPTLTASLRELSIPFVEVTSESSPGVLALQAHAREISGNPNLPHVILGDQLVNPAPYSIKVALKRFKRPTAEQPAPSTLKN